MRSMPVVYVVFGLALSASPWQVRAAEPTIEPDEGSFEERLDPSVSVSGQLLAGLMLAGHLERVDVDELFVRFEGRLGEPGDELCVRLASRDGVYAAKWTATLAVARQGIARLIIPTEKADALGEYPVDALVALATVGSGCNADGAVYIPASWGQPDRRSMTLFLNTDTSDAIIAARLMSFDDGVQRDPKKSRCRILSAVETTTAFDTLCTLSFESVEIPTEVIVLRQNFSTRLDPLRYPLK